MLYDATAAGKNAWRLAPDVIANSIGETEEESDKEQQAPPGANNDEEPTCLDQ